MTTLMLLGGLLCLISGGELLVRGASRLAASLGISPLVIGLTIVAFGTSSPELVVSIQASLEGLADMAIANVIGSNIFNILFILGACALFAPLIVSSQLVRIDVPVMIISALLLLMMSQNGQVSTIEGFALFFIVLSYTAFLVKKSRSETKSIQDEFQDAIPAEKLTPSVVLLNLFFVGVGIGLLVVGGDLLVKSAISIAQSFGISEAVIGLTIVAAGTSLPEVATSLIATIRGQRDIAIGNIVGSNIFNTLFIVGASSIVSPTGLAVSPDILSFDFPIMVAVSVACLPIFLAGFRITRLDGCIFFFCYILYVIFLVLRSTEHHFFQDFRNGMIYFVFPALILSLISSIVQAIRVLKKDGWKIS